MAPSHAPFPALTGFYKLIFLYVEPSEQVIHHARQVTVSRTRSTNSLSNRGGHDDVVRARRSVVPPPTGPIA